MAINFEKFAQEGNEFLSRLATSLGHPEEKGRTGIIMRSVMHTLRERITMGESLNLLAQLPMFLKGIYVDNWKYQEKPANIKKKEEFLDAVKNHQAQYGEQDFDWEKSTEDIVKIVLRELSTYVSRGEFEDIMAQMPQPIKELIHESLEI